MAQEKIEIKVTEDGSVKVMKNFGGVADAARRAQKTVFSFQKALKAVAFGVAARKIQLVVDGYTNLQNRIKTVTTGTAELATVTKALFDISAETRQGYKTTAEIFTRTASALQEMGVEQKTVLDFTKSLNQAVSLSGATAIEASNALIQLSQGLGSGTLRGDELRSVMEQLPKVADVISERLGVTRVALFELGKQGKISSKDILNAFIDAKDELQAEFDELTPTLSQAFTVFEARAVQAAGILNENLGLAGFLSNGLIALANSLELVARASLGVAAALGAGFIAKYIQDIIIAKTATLGFAQTMKANLLVAVTRVRVAFLALNAAMLANPFVAIAAAIAGVIGLLVGFSDKILFGEKQLANLGDLTNVVLSEIGESFSGLGKYAEDAFSGIINYGQEAIDYLDQKFPLIGQVVEATFKDIGFSFEGVTRLILRGIDGWIKLFKGLGRAITVIWNAVVGYFKEEIDYITGLFNEGWEYIATSFGEAAEAIGVIGEGISTYFVGLWRDLSTSATTFFNFLIDSANEAFGSSLKGFSTEDLFTADTSAFDGLVETLNTAGDAFVGAFEGAGLLETGFDNLIAKAEQLGSANDNVTKAVREGAGATEASKKAKKAKIITFAELLAQYKQEGELLRLSTSARKIATEMLFVEDQIKRKLLDTERQLLETTLQENEMLSAKAEIMAALNDPYEKYLQTKRALVELAAEGAIQQDQAENQSVQAELEYLSTIDPQTLAEGFSTAFRKMQLDSSNSFAAIGKDVANIFGPGGTLTKGIGDAVAQSLVFGKSFSESIGDISRQIITQLISSLVQVGITMLVNAAMSKLVGEQIADTSKELAKEVATEWHPAAVSASIATFGGAAAAGTAGFVAAQAIGQATASSFGPGYATGGYTGDGGTGEVAGVVHGQEYVMNAQSTKKFRPMLEAMNSGKTPANSNAGATSVMVSINNQIPDAEFEAQVMGPNEVEIIARRVVHQDAASVVAQDMNNPYGKTTKAIQSTTKMERKLG